MAETRRIALAFAGGGKTSEANVHDLLDDYIGITGKDADGFPILPPEEDLDVYYAIPVSDNHFTETVELVLGWLDNTEQAYEVVTDGGGAPRDVREAKKNAEEVIEVDDVNDGVIDWLLKAQEDGYEPVIILAWGEEGSEPDKDSEILLDLATSNKIPVLDLTAGLDDLGFAEEEPAAEPEPEPEPEEKPKRRGRARATMEVEEKPLEEPEPAPASSVPAWEDEPKAEEPPKRTRSRKTAPAEEPKEVQHEVNEAVREKASEPKMEEQPYLLPTDLAKSLAGFQSLLDAHLPEGYEKEQAGYRLQECMFWAIASVGRAEQVTEPPQEDAEKPSRGRGRPRSDGSPAQPRTAKDKAITEIWNEDEEEWQPRGRGRIPKDAKTRLVDESGNVIED